MILSLTYTLVLVAGVLSTPLIYDGRAPLNYTQANFDESVDPYLTLVCLLASITPYGVSFILSVVKGSENASHVRIQRTLC